MAPTKRKQSACGDESNMQKATISQKVAKQCQHNEEANHRLNKKIQIMSNSGQTGAERKALRQQLRQVGEDILSGDAALNGDGEKSAFDNMRSKNNRLWDKVRFTTEAVLESQNLELITTHAAKRANSLVTLPRYDAIKLAIKLKEKGSVYSKCGAKYFGWKDFSIKAGVCYNSLPKCVSFLHGPINAEYKQSKKRAPRRKRAADEEDVTVEQPIEVDHRHKKVGSGNELSAVGQYMKSTYRALVEKSKEQVRETKRFEEGYIRSLKSEVGHLHSGLDELIEQKTKCYINGAQKVDAIQALFDPQSFTQTVENISHLTHFIKENIAAIEVRSADEASALGFGGPGPVILPLPNKHDEPPPPKQAIVSLNMKVSHHVIICTNLATLPNSHYFLFQDWKDLCKAFEVEENNVLHREQPVIREGRKQMSAVAKRHSKDSTSIRSSSRAMPKTEELHAKPTAKVVTPVKGEREVHDNPGLRNCTVEKNGGENKATNKSRSESAPSVSHNRRRKNESTVKPRPKSQQTHSNTIDLTDEPRVCSSRSVRSDGVIDLTCD